MRTIPDSIKSKLENTTYSMDTFGMSDSDVILFPNQVLKIQSTNVESQNEYMIMQFLQGKLPVPQMIAYEEHEDLSYLLMTRISGKMPCDDEYLRHPEQLADLLANALQRLWSVPLTNCPDHMRLRQKLIMAREAVEQNLVDVENAEPGTFGKDGFKNPEELLDWLIANQPEEDLVLSHGDFCLPNLFFDHHKLSGYIDLGRCGVADRYQDIALCYRSFQSNLNGRYTGKIYDYDANHLFDALGITPDWDKIHYYILMDELF